MASMHDENTNGLLPLGAMATVLGVQPRELRHEAEAGRVPCVKIGLKCLLFDAQVVIETLLKKARTPQPGGDQ